MSRRAARLAPAEHSSPGRTHHVLQGESEISADPEVVLATLLGSCVAACVRDPIAAVGGMNHFLLPGDSGSMTSGAAERYGVHAMELLVNGLLERGALRHRLEVKLFGGSKTVDNLSDVGALNAEFAVNFLRRERITIVGECLRGTRGRRIQYWPVSGRARRIFMTLAEAPFRPVVVQPESFGALELF